MERPNTDSAPENSMVNLAGDFSDGGFDVDARESRQSREPRSPHDPYTERSGVRPSEGGRKQFQDEAPSSEQTAPTWPAAFRQKASEVGKALTTPVVDFPIDE